MKKKIILFIVILFLLVGCTNSMDQIKNKIEVVQGENTSANAQNYKSYEITCCDQEIMLYEDEDISFWAIEGYYVSNWEYSLTLKIKNELDVEQRLILSDFKINNIEVAYDQPLIYLLPNAEETIIFFIDLRYTKALGIDGLHIFNVNYRRYLEQDDRWFEKNEVSVYYELNDMLNLDEYISSLDAPIIANDDVEIWYIDVEKDKFYKRKNLYFLVHNKTDDTLMVGWEDILVNDVDQNLFNYSLINPHAYSISRLSYEVKYDYEYMNNDDDINALVKVYITNSQAKELLNEYHIMFKAQ